MNKHFIRNTLRFLLLVVVALTSGCAQSTITDSPTSTPEPFQPKGKIIYSIRYGIFSFDIESEKTDTIFSTDQDKYYSFVVQNFIYFSMGDGISGDVYRINLDGSDFEQLTFDGSSIHFSVSPKGNYLAYSNNASQLYILDIQTKKSTLVDEKKNSPFIVGPWSPDGKKFFFTQRDFSLEPSRYITSPVFLYSLENESAIVFLPSVIDFGFSSIPTWSPDGKNIALNMITESQSDDVGIYILDIESNNLQQVGTEIVADRFEWSPNGKMLAYASRTEPTRLYLFDTINKKTKIIYDVLTSWFSNYQLWSPDSKYIAYFSNISGSPWHLNIQHIESEEIQTFEVPPGINGAVWIE